MNTKIRSDEFNFIISLNDMTNGDDKQSEKKNVNSTSYRTPDGLQKLANFMLYDCPG